MPTKIEAKLRRKTPTIFGRIYEKNVTFVIDVSGSMYRCLEDVKEQLIKTISDKAINEYDSMFNIIAFSDVTYPWASSLMPCTQRTIDIAADWIRNLESKSSTNTQDALLLALSDPGTDAVYLITDGPPNDRPTLILSNVRQVSKNRPVHCLYLTGSEDDDMAMDFLKNLADQTGGSLHLLTADKNGNIRDVEKISLIDSEISSLSSLDSRKVWFQDENKFNGHFHQRNGDSSWKTKCTSNFLTSDSSNLAATLMIGKKVLARRDADGFFYLGTIIDVFPPDTFKVKFDDCPALYSRNLQQETPLKNMISYEDALRNDIHVGDKVLAPFKEDGRYEPGTVVEGFDLRKNKQEDCECQVISVATYEGHMVDVPCGASVKISEEMNERIRNEIYLPESSRRSMTNGYLASHEKKANMLQEHANSGMSRKHHSRVGKRVEIQEESDDEPTDRLRSKIERQIEEGELLLQKLYLEDHEYARELGYAPSIDSEATYDSYIEKRLRGRAKIDQDSFSNWREKFLTDTFRSTPKATRNAWVPIDEPEEKTQVKKTLASSKLKNHNKDEGYHKHRLELLNHWEKNKNEPKYSPYIVYENPTPPRKAENATQIASNGLKSKRQKRITFRTTTLKSSNQPRIRRRHYTEPRPASNEYHAFDGIPFPPSTDRKFKSQEPTESWTVDKSGNAPAQPVNIITNKPINYFGNEHNATNDRRGVSLRGTRNAAWEKRQQDLANDRAKKERVFKERQEYHRVNIEQREIERQERIKKFREGEEKNRQQSRAVRENFIKYQKEKEEKAQRYKQERLDAMKERRMNRNIQDTNRETKTDEVKEKIVERHSNLESQRRKAFESSLDNEIKMQEKKLERLRKIHASRLDKEDTRTSRAFKSRDLQEHVQDQSRQMFRASILP